MAAENVRYEQHGPVALLTMDDGKANALSHDMVDALNEALDRAEAESQAVLLAGRPGRFCAGFDLSVMSAGRQTALQLVTKGGNLLLRMFGYPRPLVLACTGHAMAAGALLLLASDLRIGARGDFKIALNEVTIGMSLPVFGVELARARLSKRHFTRAVLHSHVYGPETACDAGYLDETETPEKLLETALERATSLSALKAPAFGATKDRARGAIIASVRESIEEDIAQMAGV
jgi:enoyl-CoA hydratase